MDYKKMLSLLLAASMAVSMPINVFAAQPVTETENQTEVTPYLQPDTTPPVLHSISAEKAEVKAGESFWVNVDATDDVTGIADIFLAFYCPESGQYDDNVYLSGEGNDAGKIEIRVPENAFPGVYHFQNIRLTDKEGNFSDYTRDGDGGEFLPNELSITVINDNYQENDTTAQLVSFVINDNNQSVAAPGQIDLDVKVHDNGIKIKSVTAVFENEHDSTKRIMSRVKGTYPYEDLTDLYIPLSDKTRPGKYKLKAIQITNELGNSIQYVEFPKGTYTGRKEEKFPDGIDKEFTVTNDSDYAQDTEPPVLKNIFVDKPVVDVTDTEQKVKVTVEVEEKLGVERFYAHFRNRKNGRELSWLEDGDYDTEISNVLVVSPHEASGEFELVLVILEDKAGNRVTYYSDNYGSKVWENPNPLPEDCQIKITVVNNWKETSPTPDPTPSNPDKGTSSNSSSSSSSAVNYESEKPNPADEKAVEAYNFWQNAKAKVRTTPDGKTMRLFVPKDITYMPASMMETLYREKITLIITHNGKKIVIPAGKAMPKQKLKVYWTFESLEKLYQA